MNRFAVLLIVAIATATQIDDTTTNESVIKRQIGGIMP